MTNQSSPEAAVGSNDVLLGTEARRCDNCGKRGAWQTQTSSGKERKRFTYELAECHHRPKPTWFNNASPVWVAHGCGSGCQVWEPIEEPNATYTEPQ